MHDNNHIPGPHLNLKFEWQKICQKKISITCNLYYLILLRNAIFTKLFNWEDRIYLKEVIFEYLDAQGQA